MTPGVFEGSRSASGFLIDHRINDSFITVNRLLKSGEEVYWLKSPAAAGGRTFPAGAVFIPAGRETRRRLEQSALPIGIPVWGVESAPKGEALRLRPVRIGLWDQYGGSMTSGWVRWLLEQFEFPFEVVYPPALDSGDLRAKYDVLIFPGGAIPREEARPGEESRFYSQPDPQEVPEEYRALLGRVTVAKTVPRLREFLEAGGTVLAIGSSTALGFHVGLPISDPLVERQPDGSEHRLPREKYYIPGSVLQAKVDTGHPLALGLSERTDFYFNNSPVFALNPDAAARGVRPVAWFDGPAPLRSGWAWGQSYLEKSVAVLEAKVGGGNLYLYGPEIVFRGQPHGTFKLFFNGLYYGLALPATL
jgi:hypothetical protein